MSLPVKFNLELGVIFHLSLSKRSGISRCSIDKNTFEKIVFIPIFSDAVDVKSFFSRFSDFNFSLNPSFKFEFRDVNLHFLHKNDKEFIDLAVDVHVSMRIKRSFLKIDNYDLSWVEWLGSCSFSHSSCRLNSH